MAKARTSTKSKTKAELLQDAIADLVGVGKELHLESVDFSDPNRPKTCLEVDFPILPINHVATIEGNAGKPIYQMSKWWARRRSSVFRAMLIAAATKAPDDPADAAKLVWDSYYGNHQKNDSFRELKVADIFMGGGTTIVEGSRLGMQMYGNDLNPVAWLVVKNEMAQVDREEVQTLLDTIEAEVKPQIMPYYTCDCPRGHKGKWIHKPTNQPKAGDFDPFAIPIEKRPEYRYEGPEVIYTFWAKHGPCQATGCEHRTPIMSSPVIAVKSLTVRTWPDKQCKSCGMSFDLEHSDARMAPKAFFAIADTEKPFAVMNKQGIYACPHCNTNYQDEVAASTGASLALGKSINKKIELTLLIHPDWLKGTSGSNLAERIRGGCVTDSADITSKWNYERNRTLKLIEFRGTLPERFKLPDSDDYLDLKSSSTVPRQAHFTCQQCGLEQKVMESVALTGTHAPLSEYCLQGYCPECDAMGLPYQGRFFDYPNHSSYDAASREWESLRESSLKGCWPTAEIPFGNRTHIKDPLPKHGYSHWWKMFNLRQLLVHARLVHAIRNSTVSPTATCFVAGAFQQYLRNQNMFCIWNIQRDTPEPFFSNNNFNPKNRVAENNVFSKLGRGNWETCARSLNEVIEWKSNPWELLPRAVLADVSKPLGDEVTGKSTKVYPLDIPLSDRVKIECGSSTELAHIANDSLDLVITDPPFGDLIQYAELADFFYVWMKLILGDSAVAGQYFSGDSSPKALEAVANETRNPRGADEFYKKVLANCWGMACKKLKKSGLLAFTFHHSEDEPWIAVLESLFDAGFILEATFPIRSDETKGEGEFGSQKIEFDIVHVCRKRLEPPETISWARLRRQIMKDVHQLQDIIEHHQKLGLGEADLQVIRRGKALEYYSRHYGKVYIEKGREDEFSVKDALVGINQLLDDERDTTLDRPPEAAEPYTRQFLRLFADRSSLDRDQIQKHLRGTGVSPAEFIERGWCTEERKILTIADPLKWARDWKGKSRRAMSRDFDQAYFMIGASFEDSGIKLSDTLSSESFVPHPALAELLQWFVKHAHDETTSLAAKRALQILTSWLAKNSGQIAVQRTLFDLLED